MPGNPETSRATHPTKAPQGRTPLVQSLLLCREQAGRLRVRLAVRSQVRRARRQEWCVARHRLSVREASVMRLAGLLFTLCLLGGRLAAQVPEADDPPEPADTVEGAEAYADPETKAPWRTSYFPYLTGGTNDGPVLAFRVHHFQPAEYEDRVTTNAALTADAGVTPRGSRR